MNQSRIDSATRVTMLSKDFNIKQLEQGSGLTFNDLNSQIPYDINYLKNSYTIGGVDLLSTTNLIAAVLFIIKDKKKSS